MQPREIFFATCAPGVEPILFAEVRALRLARAECQVGGVHFEGTIEEIAPEPPAGDLVRIAVASSPRLTAEVTREAVESLGLHTGARVFASFKAAGVTVVADASGMNGWS